MLARLETSGIVSPNGVLAAVVAILAGGFAPRASDAATTEASVPTGPSTTAAELIQSIGIGAHWEQKDRVYGRHTDALVAALLALRAPHVRGFDAEVSPRLARHGITTMLTAGPEVGDPDRILAIVRQANAGGRVIDAVEGPNEADLFWPMHGYHYKGQGFPAGVLAYQRDLAAAFRAAPDLSGTLLIGPSLGKTYDPPADLPNPLPAGALAGSVDLGNFHPYPFSGNSFSPPFAYGTIDRYYWHGNFPSTNLDEFPYQQEVYAKSFAPRPMAASETGYPTWRDGVSEAVQAIYLPRLFAEYFRLGIRRTYLYELVDNGPDPSGDIMDDHFGIIRNDLTPKPAYVALRSLIALLGTGMGDVVVSAPPQVMLKARLPEPYNRPNFVHSLVLQVSDTHCLVLAWHEVADADTSFNPPRTIRVPDGSLDLSVAAPYRPEAWYAYGSDWRLERHATLGSNTVTVPLQDRIVVVSLRRGEEVP